jgi:hypothetical protein
MAARVFIAWQADTITDKQYAAALVLLCVTARHKGNSAIKRRPSLDEPIGLNIRAASSVQPTYLLIEQK